ncbi:hypothetical protein [uncultured Pontibacter sp.]|uniref:hypothetical protein n=1 Tax=uncultured Pontibacter sp. TaxID=453356 RepID=UPI00262D38CB|nr:hypothetical protein [uncultured Pontibacter sp.]
MKKLLLVAALGCLGFTAAKAQGLSETNHRFTLNIGAASPTGVFKSTKESDDEAGYAKTGALVSLAYAADVHKNIAVGATLGWRNNPFDIDAFIGEDGEFIKSAEAESWRSVMLLGNVYLQAPINNLTLYAKGSFGTAFNKSAAFKFTSVETAYGSYEFEQSAAKNSSLAVGIGGGLRYDFGRFGVGAEFDVLSTKPEYKVEYDGETESFKQPSNSFNTTVGLTYRLK